MIVAKMIALILSLGMDTLMLSISLGFVQTKGKGKDCSNIHIGRST